MKLNTENFKSTTDLGNNANRMLADSSLPRLFVAENQEFVIEGQIFTWYFSNKELRQGIVLNRKGMIEPSKFTVTVAKKKRNKKRRDGN